MGLICQVYRYDTSQWLSQKNWENSSPTKLAPLPIWWLLRVTTGVCNHCHCKRTFTDILVGS